MTTPKVNLKQLALSRQKKIDSPLAKYNGAGQLFCVLCNAQVKNEIYWTGHVNGKQHKENLTSLKKPSAPATPQQSLKRPAPDTFAVPAAPPPLKVKKVEAEKKESDVVKEAEEELQRMIGGQVKKEEVKVMEEVEEEEKKEDCRVANAAALPAGFFDDPKEDAKARGMKFKDPQDVEWDKFVKEIASEDVKSSEIVGEEQEKSAVERELDHIEEQMAQWQRVLELEKKAEEYAKRKQDTEDKQKQPMDVDDNEEDEEEDVDYDEELDWRNKKR